MYVGATENNSTDPDSSPARAGNHCVPGGGAFACPNPHLHSYAEWYWGIHGYLSLLICVFGIFTNVLNIVILTRGAMRTPINCILTAIAVCDIVTMSSYIPFAAHFYIESGLEETPEKYSYGWTLYLAVHSNISLTTHALSLWLAVFMAILRYVYLQTKKCCNIQHTCMACGFIAISVCLFNVPNYMLTGIQEVSRNNQTLYRLNVDSIGSENPSRFALTAFWLLAIVCKLIPCTLISIFIGLLLKKLHESAARRKRLFANSSSGSRNKSQGGRTKSHQCTTTMLLVIIVMYIVTEVPQTFLLLMSSFSRNFFINVYFLLADTLDMIALINNAINFVLYCTMSQQFREHLNVVKACTGPPQNARFGKKTYQSVEQSCGNNHTQMDGLCVTMSTEKSISHV